MRKNSLTSNKGLSLSQAQSVSNLCNQRAREIDGKLDGLNNYCKAVQVANGKNNFKEYITVTGKPLPTDVVALLAEKSRLHACQAFLMENIKFKEQMLQEAKRMTVDISSVNMPERPVLVTPVQLPEVKEEFGWEKLSTAELNEYIEAEAYAAHIGQFIHKGGTLDRLRNELPTIPAIEWMTIKDGEKSPVEIRVHHQAEKLIETHEELAGLHRSYEQRVNYFKAKVKNLTTEENARIAKLNADAQNDAEKQNKEKQNAFSTAYLLANEQIRTVQADFEKERQAKIKEVAVLRIDVDARFQKVIDIFLAKLSDTQE
jgi:hypothetical protein